MPRTTTTQEDVEAARSGYQTLGSYGLDLIDDWTYNDWQEFTPVFTDLTVNDGTVAARYRYAPGRMLCIGHVVFGSTSAMSSSPTMDLPDSAVFDIDAATANLHVIGDVHMTDTSGAAAYIGSCHMDKVAGNNKIRFMAAVSSGTYLSRTNIGLGIPFTWADTDIFTWNFAVPVVGA